MMSSCVNDTTARDGHTIIYNVRGFSTIATNEHIFVININVNMHIFFIEEKKRIYILK